MAAAHLILIGKPGCHLCDDARDLVGSVVAKLGGDAAAPTITFEERSILDDAELSALYLEDIPVLLINGKVHNYWRIDPVRLRNALLEVS